MTPLTQPPRRSWPWKLQNPALFPHHVQRTRGLEEQRQCRCRERRHGQHEESGAVEPPRGARPDVVSNPRRPFAKRPRLAPTAVYAGTSAGPSAFPTRNPAAAPSRAPPSARLTAGARRRNSTPSPTQAPAQPVKVTTNQDECDIGSQDASGEVRPDTPSQERHTKATGHRPSRTRSPPRVRGIRAGADVAEAPTHHG